MRFISLTAFLLLYLCSDAQDYKKDNRTRVQKENQLNIYQTDSITNVDLLKALEFAGVRIFKVSFKPFVKKYKFSITQTEYVKGKMVGSKNISPIDSNFYYHFIKNDSSNYVSYYDFIDQVSFFTDESDTISKLKVETYAGSIGTNLKKTKKRVHQVYDWRHYSKTDWELNKSIPILVYASSWFDKEYNIERFCGVSDLSYSEEATADLLRNSQHYYIISYMVSN